MSVPNLMRIALFVQKLLGGSQNFEIRSRDPGHAHLGVVLWSGRSRGPSSMSVPNLKRIALFVQKLLGDVRRKSTEIANFHTPHVFNAPADGFPLEFCIGAGVSEN